jgi:G2/mitotic-specific cyclin-B, other
VHDMEVSVGVIAILYFVHGEIKRYTTSTTQSMDQQPEIRWHMRPCLVDFLVEIPFTFHLHPETLYLTLNIVDHCLSRRIVYIKHYYKSVTYVALWIATKFEDAEEYAPTIRDLVQICRETYDESAFIQMEGLCLAIQQPQYGSDSCFEEPKVQHIARFLMEITLFYCELISHTPSSVVLGALTLYILYIPISIVPLLPQLQVSATHLVYFVLIIVSHVGCCSSPGPPISQPFLSTWVSRDSGR